MQALPRKPLDVICTYETHIYNNLGAAELAPLNQPPTLVVTTSR